MSSLYSNPLIPPPSANRNARRSVAHVSRLTCLKGVIVAGSAAWLRNVSAAKELQKKKADAR